MEQYISEVTLGGNIVIRVRVEYELDDGKPENMYFYQVFEDGSEDEIQPSQSDVQNIASDIIFATKL